PDGNQVPTSQLSNLYPDAGDAATLVAPGKPGADAGGDATVVVTGSNSSVATVTAPDCPGCLFPDAGAAPCSNAPPINIVYPADTVLLPPNLNVLSIQWRPYGGGYQRFSVDFSAPPNTDWHILTSCANQTTDEQAAGNRSGGCELTVDPASWNKLAQTKRDGKPVPGTGR